MSKKLVNVACGGGSTNQKIKTLAAKVDNCTVAQRNPERRRGIWGVLWETSAFLLFFFTRNNTDRVSNTAKFTTFKESRLGNVE